MSNTDDSNKDNSINTTSSPSTENNDIACTTSSSITHDAFEDKELDVAGEIIKDNEE